MNDDKNLDELLAFHILNTLKENKSVYSRIFQGELLSESKLRFEVEKHYPENDISKFWNDYLITLKYLIDSQRIIKSDGDTYGLLRGGLRLYKELKKKNRGQK